MYFNVLTIDQQFDDLIQRYSANLNLTLLLSINGSIELKHFSVIAELCR